MPQIQIASDLHFEFHADQGVDFLNRLDPSGVDILVLAGDVCVGRFLDSTIKLLDVLSKKYPHVVWVPGNHEFYDTDPVQTWGMFKTAEEKFPNVHILRDEAVTIMGQRFLCGTMWFPPGYFLHIEEGMNDFWTIKNFKPWVFKEHEHFLKFLKFAKPTKNDIVVTHHLPSMQSVPKFFKTSSLNPFFVVNMEKWIAEARPKMWIHGHTHHSSDYFLRATRVVCNPFGYPHSLNRKYIDKLVLDCDKTL